MNDRLYTVIFWGAISLTLHALFIVFAPEQAAMSDAGGMEVRIVRSLPAPAMPTAAAPSEAPLLPTPALPPVMDAGEEPGTMPLEPSRLVESLQAKTNPASGEKASRPVIASSNGLDLGSATQPPPQKKTAAAKPASAPSVFAGTADNKRPPEATDPASSAAANETAAIIKRLVGEDEREVAERLAEIPTTESPYWNYLMQRLAQPRWHHQQFNFRSLKRQRTLAVDLEFYPNGIVRAARIARSSGLEDLDAAAIRASYAAAPYTPPPPEDRQYGYTYRIKLKYMPSAPPG
ncbi:MAG: hypothetical protein CME36_18910 [unclassified Hahellaceae]|nr:hypothetical protein [Hahellaceae bacterium]